MKFGTFAISFFFISIFTIVNAYADENWTGVTKSPGDYTSAGTVTITGAVTLNAGSYTFTTLIVNSTLTINGDTGTNSGVIINSTTVTVGSGGSINATGKGYAGNAGSGKGNTSMGGCHAGLGGWGGTLAEFCAPYADNLQPTTLGSGGGAGGSNTPGSGGGAIKLEVSGVLTVTGSILANGTNASGVSGATKAGGGAGGSIWIQAGTLMGAGQIRANGGNGITNESGGGSGGAVAVYYGASTYSGSLSATGGSSSALYVGYPGSTLLIDSTNNDLYVSSPSMVANGTYTFRNITIDAAGAISVQGLGSKKNVGTGKGTCNGSSACSGGSYGGRGGANTSSSTSIVNSGLSYGSTIEPVDVGSGGGSSGTYSFGCEGGGAIKLVATGTITINGAIDADGLSATTSSGAPEPGGGSGGSVWIVAGNVAGTGTVQAIGGTGIGGAGGGGRIAIHYSGTLSSSLTYNVSIGSGNTTNATVGSVALVDTTNNNLSFPISSSISSGTYTYNNLTIAASAKVSAIDGAAAAAGDRPGTSGSSLSGGAGGGHGGAGGAGSGAGGGIIGDANAPVTFGSGGGSNTNGRGSGGNGGGALRLIIANSVSIGTGGNLNADGGSFVGGYAGGGSGGSIWITAKNINSVTAGITAKGGNGDASNNGGGGGGGRVAIYCSGSYSGTVVVTGGAGKASGGAGGLGSSTVKCTSPVWFFRGY